MVDAGIRYTDVPVHALLAPYVQLIWTLEVDVPTSFGSAERIFPDGIVEATRAVYDTISREWI